MRCEFCKTLISAEDCVFAGVRRNEEGEEKVFCCTQCVEKPDKERS